MGTFLSLKASYFFIKMKKFLSIIAAHLHNPVSIVLTKTEINPLGYNPNQISQIDGEVEEMVRQAHQKCPENKPFMAYRPLRCRSKEQRLYSTRVA